MKSGDKYRFSLSWPGNTTEQILAGEFLNKLANKKSRFLVQLINDYIEANPGAIDSKETIKFIVKSTSVMDGLGEMVRDMVQTELAKQMTGQQLITVYAEQSPIEGGAVSTDIDDMLDSLELFD